MHEYTITITGDYDILVLSPQMIKKLIEKIKVSDTKELVIPAEEILPQGYAEYLANVLLANLPIQQLTAEQDEVYKIISEQIDKLKIEKHKCFDKINFLNQKNSARFMVNTNEYFYMLVKQEKASFSYVYKDLDGKNLKVTLIYQHSTNDI